MSDLAITAASVIAGSGATKKTGTSGATVTAGKLVYLDSADNKLKLADSNGVAAAKSPDGIALNGAADGQPLVYLTKGPITIGATLTPGATYFSSDTPGGICPDADVGSGETVTQIGIAISASVLDVDIRESGVAR